jgi:acetyl esterase/lipase
MSTPSSCAGARTVFLAVLAALAAAALTPSAFAQNGLLRERILERMQERRSQGEGAGANASAGEQGDMADLGGGNAMSCADWSRRVARLQERAAGRNAGPVPQYRDLAYGPHRLETLDVFAPRQAVGPAPVIVMVHGGGWCVGDKGGASMTAGKVARWVQRGFVFVSVNYPMVSDGRDAIAQAAEIGRAVAFVQARARTWGGDPARLILMGHSAGAHLVSLVNADAGLRRETGVQPILGTISLDAGAIDVVTQMPRVYPFLKTRYLEAFGQTQAQWIAASPFHKLDASARPWLGVCSTTRKDDPCGQARAYAEKSNALGVAAEVLPQPKGHGALNKELGTPGAYTEAVEAFMRKLDPEVARRLAS